MFFIGIDGSTASHKRNEILSEFNLNANMKLLLVSTKAGSLGLNMVAANRLVILDPSFNPCDDQQAFSRVFRFGQKKCTFIYRFIVDESFELSIYKRQINKISMFSRVVDEIHQSNKFSYDDLRLFAKFDNEEKEELYHSVCDNNSDFVVDNLIKKFVNILSKPSIKV